MLLRPIALIALTFAACATAPERVAVPSSDQVQIAAQPTAHTSQLIGTWSARRFSSAYAALECRADVDTESFEANGRWTQEWSVERESWVDPRGYCGNDMRARNEMRAGGGAPKPPEFPITGTWRVISETPDAIVFETTASVKRTGTLETITHRWTRSPRSPHNFITSEGGYHYSLVRADYVK